VLGLVPVAALLFVAGQFDANGIVVAETRAGQAPRVPGLPSEATVLGVLAPTLDLQYLSRSLELHIDYSIRIFWRESDQDSNFVPVYLHTGSVRAASRLTRRFQLTGSAEVSEGAVDYSYLPILLGTTQATLVTVPQFFLATATAGAAFNATATTTLEMTANAVHRRPIGDPNAVPAGAGAVPPLSTGTAPAPYVLPTFDSVSAVPSVVIRLSPISAMALSSLVLYQSMSPISSIASNGSTLTFTESLTGLNVVPRIGWRGHPSRNSELGLSAGVAYSRLERSDTGTTTTIDPVAAAAFSGLLVAERDFVLKTTLGTSVDSYLDPVLGSSGLRGTIAGGVRLALPSSWTLAIEGNFATAFEAHPQTIASATVYPDETSAALSIPIRHRVSDNVIAELGGRWSNRGRQIFAPEFSFHQRELWIYLLLTATSRRVPPWGTF